MSNGGQVVVEAAQQTSTYGYKVFGKSENDRHDFAYKVCFITLVFSPFPFIHLLVDFLVVLENVAYPARFVSMLKCINIFPINFFW